MVYGRRRNRCCADFTVGGQHLPHRAEAPAAEFSCHCVRAAEIGIHYPNQARSFALLLQLFVNTRVVATEDARAYDCYRNRILRQKKSRWQVAGKEL